MSAVNSLPEILDRLALPRGARVLDIGGAAYEGEESTRWLVDAFAGAIDVVGGKPEQRAATAAMFGKRVRLLDTEAEAGEGAYDLVVVSPTLGKVMETLEDANWRAGRLLKRGGVLVTFGLDPSTLGADGFKQPDPEVAASYQAAFGAGQLPAWLAGDWTLVENTARKPAVRSYLSWLVLRRTSATASLTDGTGGSLDEGVARLLLSTDFDTLMVVDPTGPLDRRPERIAASLKAFGRRPLWIEPGAAALDLAVTAGGDPVLRLPSAIAEIQHRIKLIGASLDEANQADLERAVMAQRLARLVGGMMGPGAALLSHGGEAGRTVRAALAGIAPDLTRQVRWIHDVADSLVDLSLHAKGPRPDAVIAASGAGAASKAVRILDVQALADRFTWRGGSIRQKAEAIQEIAVYSGDGRGIDTAALAAVLAAAPQLKLVVLGGRSGVEIKALRRAAQDQGDDGRLCLLPAMHGRDVPGFIAGADVGIIGVDPEGLAEAGEIARFSDYVTAGVPVVAPEGGEVAAILAQWPVGVTYAAGGLAEAVARALREREHLSAAMTRRPDLQLRYAWETQAAALRDLWRSLWPRPKRASGSAA